MHDGADPRPAPAGPAQAPALGCHSKLFNLGLDPMGAAERKNAACRRVTAYRDGLIIALLAARPLRLANLVGLTLNPSIGQSTSQLRPDQSF